MNEATRKLLAEALRLPRDERTRLAAALIASIDGEPDEDADAACAAEMESRATRALEGRSEGRPWREALDRLDAERRR